MSMASENYHDPGISSERAGPWKSGEGDYPFADEVYDLTSPYAGQMDDGDMQDALDDAMDHRYAYGDGDDEIDVEEL